MTENEHHIQIPRPGESVPRVGLFGGTFNPVHLAHLNVATDVKKGFGLHRVYVVPSAVPPHKTMTNVAAADDRLEMVRRCFEGRDGFVVSDIEVNRKGPSFTIDTVKELLNDFSGSAEMFLMIGTDAFFEIHTWRSIKTLLTLVPLIVMTRPGDSMETARWKEERAGAYLSGNISEDYMWVPDRCCFRHSKWKEIHFYDVTQMEISSTKIRNLVKEGNTVAPYVEKGVADYITDKGLYQ